MKRELSQTEVAYIAGFLDADGAICILRMHSRRRTGTWRHYAVQVRLTNTNLAVMDWFQDRLNGTVYEYQPRASAKKRAYMWHVGGKRAIGFLKLIRPYLVIKAKQADVALGFLSLGRAIAPHARAELYEQMRELNRKGPGKTTADGAASVEQEPELFL